MLELGNSQSQNSRIRNSPIPKFQNSLLSSVFCLLSSVFSLLSLHNLILNSFGFELFVLPSGSLLILESADQKSRFPVRLSGDIGRNTLAPQGLDFTVEFVLGGEDPDEIGKGSFFDFSAFQSFLLFESFSLLLALEVSGVDPVPYPSAKRHFAVIGIETIFSVCGNPLFRLI